jgi:hypothetical protein
LTKITIGADPELFAFKEGKPVSVHDFLPGTKWNPCKVPRGAIQVDGVAAEFNIEAAATKGVFFRNIKHVQSILSRFVEKNGMVLKAVPSVNFDQEYFDNLPTEVKALGCEPDFDAYTGSPNPKPETTRPMRTGSGHVHIGWEGCNKDDPDYPFLVTEMVKELDFVLYQQSKFWDGDTERMKLYGKPGAFRWKPYGLEYRVLSNRWLSADGLIAFIWDGTKKVAENVLSGKRYYAGFPNARMSYADYMSKNEYPLVEHYVSGV